MTLPPPAHKAAAVEAMFDRIAPSYDRLNRLLTLRRDQAWRRRAVRALRLAPSDVVVDLGCGTGDMLALATARGARVIGLDVAARMLAGARARRTGAALVRGDAQRLPLRDGCASAVTSAFALRNLTSISTMLGEAARVLRPGGRLALLEVDEPRNALLRWGHALYFRRVVPLIGALLADRDAYAYLPASTAYLPGEDDLLAGVVAAGFLEPRKVRLAGGAVQLVLAVRA